MPNFKQDNDDEDVLKKIKRGFFIEQKQERNPLPLSEA